MDNTINIKYFSGNQAARVITGFVKENESELQIRNELMFFDAWYVDNKISAFALYVNKKIVSVALISTCHFDPLKIQEWPHILNFVYTLNKFRRQAYAEKILNFVKKYIQFTAFCKNDESCKLFLKTNCEKCNESDNNEMFRWNDAPLNNSLHQSRQKKKL